ncbi:DUF7453 family protein [Verrucomicrobiota bacterium sgz303538]
MADPPAGIRLWAAIQNLDSVLHLVRSVLLVLLLAVLTAIRPAACGQTFETLFAHNEGSKPNGALVRGSDGNFYGTTESGGASGYGTVFKMTPSGDLTTLVSFNSNNGRVPSAGLVEGSDGNFYGTTGSGGANGHGTVFKTTPSGDLTTLVSFSSSNGSIPRAGLAKGSDGNFYGTTYAGGASGQGTVFKMTPDGELTTLVSFNISNGFNPYAGLVEGSDGNFYGTTESGGASSRGTVFKVASSGELTTLVSFNSINGSSPRAGLVKGSDGNFYGTTRAGGATDEGTVFKVTPSGTLTTLVSFNSANGSKPSAGLVLGSDGNFYGTTQGGGKGGNGTAFKMTPAGALTTLIVFNTSIGTAPSVELVEGSDGNFYGTTYLSGPSRSGTVFKMTPAGELTVLVAFNFVPSNPRAGLVEGSDGNFYGTTETGGASGWGTVFKVTPSGALTTLVSFNATNGIFPRTGLVRGSDSNFYGTTSGSGPGGYGTVFKVTPAGELTTLVSFDSSNGSEPYAELVEGSDGNFYGTTFGGGADGYGTIFKMTPTGALTTIASLPVSSIAGYNPRAGLVEGSDGNFYGTTTAGGANGYGTIFRLSPIGELSVLVPFDHTNGSNPRAGLVEGSDGNFYGTTYEGGPSNLGTVFKVTPAGELTTLVSFGSSNGSYPHAGLVEGSNGSFYGTTEWGGDSNRGTIFVITSAGKFTMLHSFDGVVAAHPEGALVFGSDGKLYGPSAQMAIWRLSVATAPTANTAPASAITITGADLSGIVNANGADTTATFEYGLTTDYGSNVSVTPSTITGRYPVTVSASLLGLSPHVTYYYRLTASNSEGTTSTAGASFTTANRPPVATNDSIISDTNNFGAISFAVLGNDSDVDGDQLTITDVTQGSFGTVSTDGATITYVPGPAFVGRDSFTYTVSDGFDTATAQVELQGGSSVWRALLSRNSEVPGAGQPGSGIPAGALFKNFGVPSINTAGRLTFTTSYAAPGNSAELSVLVMDRGMATSTVVARRGQVATGTHGALFSSFKDPLLNEAGEIALLATLSGGDTTKANNQGLWVSSFPVDGAAKMQLVARTGTQAIGVRGGARWKSFTSVVFSSGDIDAPADAGTWSLAFTAFMVSGPGDVSASNDMGLWIASPGKMMLALREGQTLETGGMEKQIKSFGALKALPATSGQGSCITNTGAVAVQAFFNDGSQALLQVSNDIAWHIAVEALALPGDPVADTAEITTKFGIPTQSGSGTVTAWLGSLNGKSNPAAIFERNLSEPELLKLLARKGDSAAGIEGASFSTFRSVAVNDTGGTLFLGKVSGRGISSSNDEGLWWKQSFGFSDSDAHGYLLRLLAREGAQPPGVPEGVRWSSFTSLALSEGPYGPLFTAKLVGGAKGKGPGKITSANDQGLWAVDSKGELQLVVQEGQEVNVEGSSTPKILKSFAVLSAVPGSPTQRRSFAGDGQIVYRALFTDGSQAIVKVQLP